MTRNIQIKMADFTAIKDGTQAKIPFHSNDFYKRRFGTLGLTTRGEPNGTILPITLTATAYDENKNRITHQISVTASLVKNKNEQHREKYILRIHSVENNESVDASETPSAEEQVISSLRCIINDYINEPVSDAILVRKLRSVIHPFVKGV